MSHPLDREMLEEVRFLLNFRMDAQSGFQIIDDQDVIDGELV